MSINFPKTEEDVIRFWREINAFETQVKLNEGKKSFVALDGPPFATGLPHYGHLLTSTIKDVIPRYWAMKGYHVPRQWGWDTHGLPIEYEIDKKLGISGRAAVEQMGIGKYNEECRAIVMRYSAEWKDTVERIGRWTDMDNAYKTMDATFMESCWWGFKQLFNKDQIYRAFSIMPFSTALCTPLSQMEAKSNEKMTVDPAVLVSFPVVDRDVSLVIYTTTPWTLPSNLLVAVHKDYEYLEILDEDLYKRKLIVLQGGLKMLYKDPKKAKYKVLRKFKGQEMIGWKYEPLFHYFAEEFKDCFQVIGADYVEEEEGTGLVHQAPAFGQEDYDAAVAAGFIGPKRLPPCPVDEKGQFTNEITEYAGQHVKVADKQIIKDLKTTGRLLVATQISHVDKFCWRSDTQLIRRAVSSWFIKITDDIPGMIEHLEPTNWVPAPVKSRQRNWIASARDWNVSRNRYWGTPIPLWVSSDYDEVVCVGSREELKELSGYTGEISDIHRDKIDHITITSKKTGKVLRRIDEVFDCWFESGSMPWASVHYPFEHKEDFHTSLYPADFIAEGLDQTRGWFYTMIVMSYKIFGVSPYKNLICNGLVLAKDGSKMSKSKANFSPPKIVIDQFGADALRLYLINSPVVRADPLRFEDKGVAGVIARVLLPLWNSYSFLRDQTVLYEKNTGKPFLFSPPKVEEVNNILDHWILANCQRMLKFINQEMNAYRLYTVVPELLNFIEAITNWYIRMNRRRLKGAAGLGTKDTEVAMNVLTEVLFTMIRALAPFMPFLTEHIYGLLKPVLGETLSRFEVKDPKSVHWLPFPEVQEKYLDEQITRKFAAMQQVIQLTRTARERNTLPLKMPLLTLVVIADAQMLSDIAELETYVKEELNIRELVLSSDEAKYNIELEARVDWPTLGKKLRKDVGKVKQALPNLTQDDLRQFLEQKKLNVAGVELVDGDLNIVRVVGKQRSASTENFEASFSNDMIILLDITPHPELADEKVVRDIISRIQRMRKRAGLVPTDDVRMQYHIVSNPDEVNLESVLTAHEKHFITTLRGQLEPVVANGTNGTIDEGVLLEEEHELENLLLKLRLSKN